MARPIERLLGNTGWIGLAQPEMEYPAEETARTKAWRWKEKKGQCGRCRMSEEGEGREAGRGVDAKKGLGAPSREAKQLA